MLNRAQFWTLIGIAALGAVLVGANIVMFLNNRSVQIEINGRAQYVQQTVQLEVLYREIVKALADLSVKNKDVQLRGLLIAHGISVTVNAPGPGGAPVAESARRAGGK